MGMGIKRFNKSLKEHTARGGGRPSASIETYAVKVFNVSFFNRNYCGFIVEYEFRAVGNVLSTQNATIDNILSV